MDFQPRCYKQMAGLVLYYDYDNYLYLHVTHDEELGRVVTLLQAENKRYTSPFGYISLPAEGAVRLRITLREGMAAFAWEAEGVWHHLPGEVDASFLSDEACTEGWFTGTMVGLCCQDLTASRLPADFDYLEMRVSP